jgi:Protein of unknown function (DUF3035)
LYGDGKMETVPQQGVDTLKMGALSPAEQAIIGQSGSDKADPRIRSTLDKESGQRQVVGNRKLIDTLTFWKEPKKIEQGTAIDPVAERARLDGVKVVQPIKTGTP